ncbi:MAG: amidohydrolase family protein [Phycisphaerales bacterium]|nr:amidohydrolase family protein [Phycisphaerales bacterium]
MRHRFIHSLALVAGAFLCAAASAQDQPIVFTGARIIPVGAREIDSGMLLVQHGKIVSIGVDLTLPEGTTRVDLSGKTVMPGLVDTHSHIGGAAGADSSSPIQPEVRVADSLSPFDAGMRRALAGGITTVNVMPGSGHLLSGQTIYLKLRSRPGEARTIESLFMNAADGDARTPAGGLKMANGTNSIGGAPFPGTRAKSAALVRDRFIKAREYAERQAGASASGKPEDGPARDLGNEAIGEALRGERIVQHHTHRADDIMTVLRLQKEFGFRVVLHHVSEAWKVADEIALAQKESGGKVLGCSVILVDSPGGKLEAAGLSLETCAVLERAGVNVCIHTDDWITDSRLFLRSAGLAVRGGMSREGALAAVTRNGAAMLDLGDRVGSLEAGKDADFIVLSGDPLSVASRIEQTWVEGRKVFDLSDPVDRVWAEGGYGAGQPQRPYLCCVDGAGVGSGE